MIYRFPNSVQFQNNHIAVSSVSMYYSWFNISATLNNNKFYYTWYNAAGIISVGGNPYFTVTVPDGLYEVSQLNSLLQFNMINNGTYLINTTFRCSRSTGLVRGIYSLERASATTPFTNQTLARFCLRL